MPLAQDHAERMRAEKLPFPIIVELSMLNPSRYIGS